MTRILMAGDMHGDLTALETACQMSKKLSCDAVLQLGDWGFLWPGKPDKHEWARDVVDAAGVRFIFIDGNHDWLDGIKEVYPDINLSLLDIQPGEMAYLGRGRVLTLPEGRTILGMGGAGSVDRYNRTEGVNWFQTEFVQPMPPFCARHAVAVTHDTPFIINDLLPGFRWPEAVLEECADSRKNLMAAVWGADPDIIIHGHMHYSTTSSLYGTVVRALAHAQHSGGPKEWLTVLNTTVRSVWLEGV